MWSEFGMSASDPRRTSTRGQGRRCGRFLAVAALAGVGLVAGFGSPAQAATTSLYAAPADAGTADCSSPANACVITTAVTNANAAPITDSLRIELAKGNYLLPAPTPVALPITFAGPSLTIEAASGTPTLNGKKTTTLLSVAAGSNVTIDGLEIEFGLTTGLGGGIQNNGTLTVRNSTFSSNTGGNGGAISNSATGTLAVEDSTFSHNTTTGVGGGAIINFGAATIERSAMTNNEASINGGAINVQPGGVLTVTSSTIANNASGGLGGGLSSLGTLNVQASTIANNTATSGAALATGNTNVTFATTIIAGQSSADACNPVNAAITDGGYNLDDDGTCISPTTPAEGSHNGTTAYGSSTYGAALDAYLADGLANNGGPTRTFALVNSPDPATALANPALDVVPASFSLPVAVDGVSAACAVSDQRRVLPAAGGSCGIGAYLLQGTKTAVVASAATVGLSKSVTYTATVTPQPDGGTVSFDDGAGNPATAQCAAQRLSNGTATCTVAYGSPGVYPVTATYSGDGAENEFAASAGATQTTVEAPPAPAPAPAPTPPAGCRSDRSLSVGVTLAAPRGVKLSRTVIRVNGNVNRNLGARVTRFTLALNGYPAGLAEVVLKATTTTGRTLAGRRTYRLCGYSTKPPTRLTPLHFTPPAKKAPKPPKRRG
jgi:hypothetical protein